MSSPNCLRASYLEALHFSLDCSFFFSDWMSSTTLTSIEYDFICILQWDSKEHLSIIFPQHLHSIFTAMRPMYQVRGRPICTNARLISWRKATLFFQLFADWLSTPILSINLLPDSQFHRWHDERALLCANHNHYNRFSDQRYRFPKCWWLNELSPLAEFKSSSVRVLQRILPLVKAVIGFAWVCFVLKKKVPRVRQSSEMFCIYSIIHQRGDANCEVSTQSDSSQTHICNHLALKKYFGITINVLRKDRFGGVRSYFVHTARCWHFALASPLTK